MQLLKIHKPSYDYTLYIFIIYYTGPSPYHFLHEQWFYRHLIYYYFRSLTEHRFIP